MHLYAVAATEPLLKTAAAVQADGSVVEESCRKRDRPDALHSRLRDERIHEQPAHTTSAVVPCNPDREHGAPGVLEGRQLLTRGAAEPRRTDPDPVILGHYADVTGSHPTRPEPPVARLVHGGLELGPLRSRTVRGLVEHAAQKWQIVRSSC